jgi:2',3'-cyclic-nucleotide 2'-phosphodiesterase
MNILFCGDVVGRSGRDAVIHHVPKLRIKHKLDAVIVSGDNAAGGFGISPENCHDFFKNGVDIITGGDHIWDQKDTYNYLNREPRLLRPHNFPASLPGSGIGHVTLPNGKKLIIIHLLGQVFHKEYLNCPFACLDVALKEYPLSKQEIAGIVVDMHCEATSEKNAMGVYADGRVSAVVGSHTHIPTADARLLPQGTAYQTDVGMCGDYNSIIGFEVSAPLQQFLMKRRRMKMQPATGEGTLCAALIEIGTNGLATSITSIKLGGVIG